MTPQISGENGGVFWLFVVLMYQSFSGSNIGNIMMICYKKLFFATQKQGV